MHTGQAGDQAGLQPRPLSKIAFLNEEAEAQRGAEPASHHTVN